MYLNLFARKDRSLRKLNINPIDRGKKHYWINSKGDYGFYQSDMKIAMSEGRLI